MMTLRRNDPCWCGSGKKYKKCHLVADLAGKGNPMPEPEIDPPEQDIIIKTPVQIEGIRRACRATRDILNLVADMIGEGVTTDEIDALVYEETIARGGFPAPLNYNGFPKSVCTSVNDVVCHGIPNGIALRSGDIVNVDVTTILDGYFGDASRMFHIGEVSEEARRLVRVTRECLEIGLEQALPGNRFGDIGFFIQKHAEAHGYSVVRDYTGHGVGLSFHEPPTVLHYGRRGMGPRLRPGMVFTIEPMINSGDWQIRLLNDGWTAVTKDGSLSAQWEHTALITETGVEALTENYEL